MEIETTKREMQLKVAKKVNWTLIDNSNRRFSRWHCSAGYNECFPKGVDPNIVAPYGLNCPLTDDEIRMRLGVKEKQEKEENNIPTKNNGKWGGYKAGCHIPWNKGKSVKDILDADAKSKVLRG